VPLEALADLTVHARSASVQVAEPSPAPLWCSPNRPA
jgi:hypothetical protein